MIKETRIGIKYDKQDQQGKVEFSERSPPPDLVARSPGGPQTKQDRAHGTGRQTTT
jgi:hypothetical protein